MQLAIATDEDRLLVLDPVAVRAALAPFELVAVRAQELDQGRAWAARMIGPAVAAPEALARVHRRMGDAALFLRREESAITGMLAWIALTGAGLDAVLDGRFSGCDPDDAYVARPGEPFAACYGWGVAASHKTASRAVLGATAVLNDVLFPDAPFFTRAATADGRRVIVERFRYQHASAADRDLFWRPPVQKRAA